ncbi:MAG TPA: hypothetical protein VHC18_11495 [Amycolatopsis sp.]|nr:hypothetical protein [Amycolatopsis sp.]
MTRIRLARQARLDQVTVLVDVAVIGLGLVLLGALGDWSGWLTVPMIVIGRCSCWSLRRACRGGRAWCGHGTSWWTARGSGASRVRTTGVVQSKERNLDLALGARPAAAERIAEAVRQFAPRVWHGAATRTGRFDLKLRASRRRVRGRATAIRA